MQGFNKTMRWLVLCAALPVQAAGDFAAPGSKATLTVEYRFEAQGRQQDKLELREWSVQRSAELVAELVAKKPAPLPVMLPMEAAQQARLGQQQAQMQRAATQMAPMMAGAQAIIDKCGSDEACMEREAMKMGAAMSGTPQLQDTLKTGRETAAVMQPGADRYQAWEGRTQKGRYAIDERWHVVHADPICMTLPKARCTHDMTRQGSGELPASATVARLEVDSSGAAMSLLLPVPLAPLNFVETHSTDEPAGTHSNTTPRGPQKGQLPLRVTADGKSVGVPITLALKGGWRSQSGEQVIAMGAGPWHGAAADNGRLVVRWKFSVQ
jgi:hypothetical protein